MYVWQSPRDRFDSVSSYSAYRELKQLSYSESIRRSWERHDTSGSSILVAIGEDIPIPAVDWLTVSQLRLTAMIKHTKRLVSGWYDICHIHLTAFCCDKSALHFCLGMKSYMEDSNQSKHDGSSRSDLSTRPSHQSRCTREYLVSRSQLQSLRQRVSRIS